MYFTRQSEMDGCVEMHLITTHRRDWLIGIETEGIPQIELANGLKALGPVHVGNDVSPCRGKVLLVFTFLDMELGRRHEKIRQRDIQ
jgi:hypothetical protein